MVEALKLRLQAFTRLSQEDLGLIEQIASRNVREIGPRRDLIREGEKPRAVNLILDGWACCYKQLPDGRRQIVSFFIAGDLCDPIVFILSEMDHSIGAITHVRYAEISPADFEDLMMRSPRVTEALWWCELVNTAVAREWTVNVGQRSAFERIAHLFCEMYLRLKTVGLVDNGHCHWPLTQADLAEATGLTAVHVNRTLQDMRRRRLIELQGRKLTIVDLDRLKAAAMFNPNYLHLGREGRQSDTVV